jgi:hypothetical protein
VRVRWDHVWGHGSWLALLGELETIIDSSSVVPCLGFDAATASSHQCCGSLAGSPLHSLPLAQAVTGLYS